ncbi:CRISPR-associated protein Cas4 [Fusibacter sp. 3D3]|uniref:CRISPR-associated protein Cas4 n=1 Tax=Fusibacter sp. 3D3 TaxID=1048380 RepID=UPI00085295A3|nr:CRISPR-associated protein Cas4 [Fusibacter sp. 3D3]GAU77703.1 CRISPR-associated RecB family exonuclease Cas4a [Fusibacter sp. 3D3]
MRISGTLMNYYFHCKRQCYLFGNKINLEDNSELVKIGKALHQERYVEEKSEIAIENIKLDKIDGEYLIEYKKSNSDVEASKWQLLYYLKVLKGKGILKKGKLICLEKANQSPKILFYELDDSIEHELTRFETEISELINAEKVPPVLYASKCKKCAYYSYCML